MTSSTIDIVYFLNPTDLPYNCYQIARSIDLFDITELLDLTDLCSILERTSPRVDALNVAPVSICVLLKDSTGSSLSFL